MEPSKPGNWILPQTRKDPSQNTEVVDILLFWFGLDKCQVPTKTALSLPLLNRTRGEEIWWKAQGLR